MDLGPGLAKNKKANSSIKPYLLLFKNLITLKRKQ